MLGLVSAIYQQSRTPGTANLLCCHVGLPLYDHRLRRQCFGFGRELLVVEEGRDLFADIGRKMPIAIGVMSVGIHRMSCTKSGLTLWAIAFVFCTHKASSGSMSSINSGIPPYPAAALRLNPSITAQKYDEASRCHISHASCPCLLSCCHFLLLLLLLLMLLLLLLPLPPRRLH